MLLEALRKERINSVSWVVLLLKERCQDPQRVVILEMEVEEGVAPVLVEMELPALLAVLDLVEAIAVLV